MEDRYTELRHYLKLQGKNEDKVDDKDEKISKNKKNKKRKKSEKDDEEPKEIELGEIIVSRNGSLMHQESYRNVTAVKLCLGTVEDSNRNILELRDRLNRITTEAEEKNVRQKLDKAMELNKTLFDKAKALIDETNSEIKKLEEEDPEGPDVRNLGVQSRALTGRFKELLIESQEAQNEIRGKMKDKIVRQVKILDVSMTQQEAEGIAEDPNAFQELLMKRTLGQPHMRLRHTVEDIEEKYREIQKLEQSVEHILQLLSEIGIIVEAQGEFINTIEAEINKANNYVERAEKHLVKAKKQHQRDRKKMCCIVICLTIIVLIVAIPIVLKLT